MRAKGSQTFAAFAGAALLLGAAVSPARSAGPAEDAASDSGWYAPLAELTAPGAVRPHSAASPVRAARASSAGVPHMMLMKGVQLTDGRKKALFGADAVDAAAAPLLKYYGGPLLGNVKVHLVYWNQAVANQDKLPGFFSAITQSAYFDWLTEYDAPNASIGRGSYTGAYVDSAQGSGQIDDTDIRAELSSLIGKKAVPQADANTLYMVYFPPGLTVTMGGSASCQVFCAYHNTFTNGGQEINYGVIPDQGGSCAGGCGGNADQFNNETSVSSHELIEAVTDPAVGLVQGDTPVAPLGWYDATNGEIGDICNADQAQVGAYTVQRLWSNSRGLCVATAADPGDGAGAPPVAGGGNDSGSIGSRP